MKVMDLRQPRVETRRVENRKAPWVRGWDLRFPVWKQAPDNQGPPRVRIQGSNTICLLTVEHGKLCNSNSFVKLK